MNSKRYVNKILLATTALVAIAATVGSAQANLTLTEDGIKGGFKLDTSSSGYIDSNTNGTGVGPLSVGFTTGGGTVVSYYNDNSLVFYKTDANNQTVAANGTVVKGFPTITGIVTTGGYIYAADQGAGSILKLNRRRIAQQHRHNRAWPGNRNGSQPRHRPYLRVQPVRHDLQR